jgi:hypothetical protein
MDAYVSLRLTLTRHGRCSEVETQPGPSSAYLLAGAEPCHLAIYTGGSRCDVAARQLDTTIHQTHHTPSLFCCVIYSFFFLVNPLVVPSSSP